MYTETHKEMSGSKTYYWLNLLTCSTIYDTTGTTYTTNTRVWQFNLILTYDDWSWPLNCYFTSSVFPLWSGRRLTEISRSFKEDVYPNQYGVIAGPLSKICQLDGKGSVEATCAKLFTRSFWTPYNNSDNS